MPNKTECVICDEVRDVDEDEICAQCHGENAADTADELRAAGIDPADAPVVVAAEIARRVF
ncbi:hypothetical protein HCJ76_44095 [Streptomyces sp. MC1]|uniref:hypothetical protein n=1 Tax=Streptomyces sp. MC1 TaxID=295105 RepID=UPI0018CBAC8C|nr:hypothetical protein [Streptomyces sp. MC1]MBG7704866.1 hypothetical protein [Streptomyces sp. MC1]